MDNFKSNSGGLHELSLFTGCGGGLLASHLLGWRTVCAVEYEQYPASVLAQRQNDKLLPPFPIWDNVRTFDGSVEGMSLLLVFVIGTIKVTYRKIVPV